MSHPSVAAGDQPGARKSTKERKKERKHGEEHGKCPPGTGFPGQGSNRKGSLLLKEKKISSAEITAEPERPLNAEYWTSRKDGESYPAWVRRRHVDEQIRIAQRHLDLARSAMKRARKIMAMKDEGPRNG